MKRPFSALFLTLALGCPAGDDSDTNDTGADDGSPTGDGSGTADDGMDDDGMDDGGPSSGPDSSGGADDGSVEVNGCTKDGAMDLTGMTEVDITAVSPWSIGHTACIIVDAGTTVTWSGDFMAHPLVGGETPTTDFDSPISSGQGTEPSVDITFDDAGDFPYFCIVHTDTMQGVVYVE